MIFFHSAKSPLSSSYARTRTEIPVIRVQPVADLSYLASLKLEKWRRNCDFSEDALA